MPINRNYAIDFLKLTAILGVIIIHTSTAFIDRSLPFSLQFDTLVLVNQLFRFSVPLFFASSGIILALIYNKQFDILLFYKKRVLRIFPPYVFWFLIYYFFVFPHPITNIFKESFYISFLYGEASYQLYFIPIIIILYIMFPVFMKHKNIFLSKIFLFMLGIATILFLSLVYYANFVLTSVSPVRGAFYNLFPFLLGMYVGIHYEKVSKLLIKEKNKFYFFSLVLGAILFIETVNLFAFTQAGRFLRDQWRFTVVLYTCFASVSLFNIHNTFFKNAQRPIEKLSRLSFGVFFMHVLVLHLILKNFVAPLNLYNLPGFFITTGMILIISFIGIFTLSKMPLVGKIISAT